MNESTPGTDECSDYCQRLAATLLLGPLRPDVSVCVHGHRYTLDELFPPPDAEPLSDSHRTETG